MNYQNNLNRIETEFIYNRDDIIRESLSYYAWPQTYATTAGPFGHSTRIAGQAFSTFTIDCWTYWEDNELIGYMFCNGVFIMKINNFDPITAIKGKYLICSTY